MAIVRRMAVMTEDNPERPDQWKIVKKWGLAASGGRCGWQGIPDLLLKKQYDLELTATDLVVLLNITMEWWDAEQLPHPRPSQIAKNMGVDTRTVERSIKRLQDKNLVERLPSKPIGESGRKVREYTLSGLKTRLLKYAFEIKEKYIAESLGETGI